MRRVSVFLLLTTALIQPAALLASQEAAPETTTETAAETTTETTSGPLLVARDAGLDFVHVGGDKEAKRYIVEENGSGVALFDYDGDGDLDLYFVNGSKVEWMTGAADSEPPGNVLYRNDTTGGSDSWSFVDVTAEAGVGDTGWGQGVAVGDVEGDGDVDVFVANYGRDVFYLNRGDGTFEDAADDWGPGAEPEIPSWSAAAAFADFDGDGDLDLYVSRYLDLDLRNPPTEACEYKGVRVACGPIGFPAQRDLLYENYGENRDGTFVEISTSAGLADLEPEFGLGVLASDLDGDGWPELVVANDSGANFLLQNLSGTSSEDSVRFEESAWLAGVATSGDGRFQAGMGVDAGDVDGDGVFDLVFSHFMDDHNTLYRGSELGGLLFRDASYPSGLGGPSRLRMAWGTRLFDADHDGDLDLYVGNGHLYPEADAVPSETFAQPDQLFLGDGAGRFVDASDRLVGVEETVSRGVATGDLDGDGDLDMVVTQLDREPVVLENRASGQEGGTWLGVDVARFADLGTARVVVTAGDTTQIRHAGTSGSFASASSPLVHFGLGDASGPVELEVRFGRSAKRWRGLEAGALYRLPR